MSEELKNKPLVEAILEVRWELKPHEEEPQVRIDPHFRLLPGTLSDRVNDDYPYHEQLPTADLPDQVAGHKVQHRFRSAEGEWPLLQLGPGILTLNDTQSYTWTDFRGRAVKAITKLFEAYPKREALSINSLLLRYIDAEPINPQEADVFSFLSEKMGVDVSLPKGLFEAHGVSRAPTNMKWQASFACDDPEGRGTLKFATGQREEEPALIWETILQSAGADVPPVPSKFEQWLDAAHEITHGWFFELIKGELEEKYRGE